MAKTSKLKVVRVITAPIVVPWHLANTLARMPDDFEVCVVGQGVSSWQAQYPQIKWVDINIVRQLDPLADLLALLALCRFLHAYKPDIVHSIMPKSGLLTAIAGFICRVPVRIHTFTGQIWATESGFARRLYYGLDRLINALNTLCLTDSPSQSAFLYQHQLGNAGKPLPVLLKGSLSGVDVARFDKQALAQQATQLRTSLAIKPTDVVFAFIARKSLDKGGIDILHAFATVAKQHPNAKLLYIGPDESGGELERLHNDHQDMFNNVLEIGTVPNHELYLAITHVLCLPSYREGFGSIVIDAAAMGVATIGSDISGLRDSVEDGKTGQLFPAGDLQSLSQLMLNAVQAPDTYQAMGLAARARVDTFFTADLLYQALKALYLQLAGHR